MKINFQKTVLIIFLFALLSFLSVTVVKANSGPPANVRIEVINNEVDFEFDLLIHKESLLTQDQIDEALLIIANGTYDYAYEDTSFLLYMASYQDSEGFVSNLLYGDVDFYESSYYSDGHGFFAQMYLNVPKEFKVLLQTDEEKIITSELITMSQFDYRLTLDLADVDMSVNQENVGVVSGYIGSPWFNLTTWFNFLLRLILTLGIELGVLYLFGFRKKATFVFVSLMNIVTQVVLNIVLISVFYYNPSNPEYIFAFTFIIGEFFVFVLELIIVSIFVKEHKLFRKIAYSLLANTASLVIGLYLASKLSFII